MIKLPASEQFAKLQQPAIDASLQFAQLSLGTAERFVSLQVAAARQGLEQATEGFKSLSQSANPSEFLAQRTRFTEAAVERAVGLSTQLLDLAKQTGAELTTLVEQRVGAFNKEAVAAIDKVVAAAPAGSEGAVAAIKAGLSAAAAGVDGLTKAAKQVGEYVDAGVKAGVQATSAAVTAAKAK